MAQVRYLFVLRYQSGMFECDTTTKREHTVAPLTQKDVQDPQARGFVSPEATSENNKQGQHCCPALQT